MGRLIEAEALKASVREKFPNVADRCEINELINAAPTIDAIPVVHGRWVIHDDLPPWFSCGVCGKGEGMARNYCPDCGAKMDGGEGNA